MPELLEKPADIIESVPQTASWPAVVSVALGAFVLVTSEFLPVGLLPEISRGLHVSNGTAGLMVTTPGIVAAITAPLLTAAAGRLDRRIVLLAFTFLVIASNALAALAPSFPVVLAGRMLLGACVGGFWTFAAAIGRRLVPEEYGGKATALILTGISAGTVCGLPAGAFIGDLAGWRMAFAATGGLAALALVAQIFLLPSLPTSQAIRLRDIFGLFRIPKARVGLLASSMLIGGHFAGYTYLKPFLQQIPHMSQSAITTLLIGFGVAGMIGNYVGERATARNVRSAFIGTALILAAVTLLAPIIGGSKIASIALVGIWGLAFGAIPISTQIWMYQAEPKAFESGSALMVSIFQVGLALGALLGGIGVDHFGVSSAMILGGIAALATAGVIAKTSHALAR